MIDEMYEIEVERYELNESAFGRSGVQAFGLDSATSLSRRDLLKALGAGLLILCLSSNADGQESGGGRRRGGGGQGPRDIGAWVHVAENGAITAFSGKAEVGQNARTSLAMAVAEELRVPLASVRVVLGDTELTPYDMGTFGSMTTPRMWPMLRQAAAAARETLLDRAAQELKAERATLTVADGRILHGPSGRSLGYGELTKGQKLADTISSSVTLTPADQWKVAGHSAGKLNARDIVTGRHKYSTDMQRPGMMYGKVLRPDGFGATLESIDISRAEKMPGVKVVREGDFIGIVAPDQHSATSALDAIQAKWKPGAPQVSSKTLFAALKPSTESPEPPKSDVNLRSTYQVAYIAHAPLEPRTAVAEWQDGKLTVWTGTQRPFGVKSDLAQAMGISEDHVHVIVPDTGSGYGGKHTGEAAIEAARLAKASGKPVKLIWTREEEMTWAYFRPAGVIDVASAATKDGQVTGWEFHNYNSGGSAIRSPYDVPGQVSRFHNAPSPLRQGSYRGLAATANNFARECHMDELAHELKADPLEFRLKNLKDPRMIAVLQDAAKAFAWGKRHLLAGHGVGIACGTEKGSYVATCVEVEALKPAGGMLQIRIVEAVTAFECGAIVNPDQLKNQVEGAVIMGIGGALYEAIEFENGRILNPRFSKYRVPRFSDVPALKTVLLDRKDLPGAGAGETPIIGIAPAISNAIFAASGLRLRSLPMLLGSNGKTLAQSPNHPITESFTIGAARA